MDPGPFMRLYMYETLFPHLRTYTNRKIYAMTYAGNQYHEILSI